MLTFGDMEIDTEGMEVRRAGAPVALTPTEMRLLLEFSAAPGTVLSRDRLLERVWDYGWGGDTRVVDVHVQRLRTKIGQDRIETVRGFGYKLQGMRAAQRRMASHRLTAMRAARPAHRRRWKISIAIAGVSALVALALSLVVHNAAQVSMLDNAREVQLERTCSRSGCTTPPRRPSFGTRIDDPMLPRRAASQANKGRRATYVQRRGGVPAVWAAVPLRQRHGALAHSEFADRSTTIIDDLDRALIVGSRPSWSAAPRSAC